MAPPLTQEQLLQQILDHLKSGSTSSGASKSGGKKRSTLRGSVSNAELDDLKARKEHLDDLNAQEERRLDLLGKLTAAQNNYNTALDNNASAAEMAEVAAALKEATENVEGFNEGIGSFAAGTQAFESMAESVLGLSGPMETLSQIINGGRNSMLGFGTTLRDGVVSGTLFIGIAMKMIDSLATMALETDAALASFRASTGAGNEFNEVIADIERSTFQAGVTFGDVTAAVTSLKNVYTDFTYLSKQQQKDLGTSTALLQTMGLEFGTQSEVMQIATQSMNMSLSESQALMLDIASIARSLGQDINDVGQDFIQNADFLVRFGKDGKEVFEDLAVSAKALGTEMGLLVKVTEGFQTFDEAGAQVGRLNAILGGPFLNAMDMLNASYEDPVEGIRMLRDGFDAAGRSIEDLSGAELMAVSKAMGLSLTETKELLGETNEEMEIRRIKEAEVAAEAAKTQSITDALSNSMRSLYLNMEPVITKVIIPLTEKISKFATIIGDFLKTKDGFIGYMTAIGASLGAGIGLMLAFTAAIPVVGATMAALSASQVLMYASIGGLAGGVLGNMAGNSLWDPSSAGTTVKPKARFASGGVVQATSVAMVGEHGPEMVEMPVGSRVTSAPVTQQLTDAIANLSRQLNNMNAGTAGTQQIAVYIGQEKIDELVVKGLNSNAGRKALSPFGNG